MKAHTSPLPSALTVDGLLARYDRWGDRQAAQVDRYRAHLDRGLAATGTGLAGATARLVLRTTFAANLLVQGLLFGVVTFTVAAVFSTVALALVVLAVPLFALCTVVALLLGPSLSADLFALATAEPPC